MASIRSKGNGTYLITVSGGRDSKNKQILHRKTYKPQMLTQNGKPRSESAILKDVKDFADEFEKTIKKNGKRVSRLESKMKFKAYVSEHWLTEYAKMSLTPGTVDGYCDLLRTRVYPYIGNMYLTDIETQDITDIIRDEVAKGHAPKTVKRTFTAINSVFRHAYNQKYIFENPCERVTLPKVEKKRSKDLHYFTVDQISRFLEALSLPYPVNYGGRKRRDKKTGEIIDVKGYSTMKTIPFQFQVYYQMAFYGAFRRGEEVCLTWNDILWDSNKVDINKAAAKTSSGVIIKEPKSNASYRTQTMPDHVMQMLRKLHDDQMADCEEKSYIGFWNGKTGKDFEQNYIFTQEDGSMMNIDTPYHKFKKIIKQYNETYAKDDEAKMLPDIRLHDTRHTTATLLIGNGSDIETVQNILGHAKASVTLDVYADFIEENKERATNKLSELLKQNGYDPRYTNVTPN